MIASTDTEGVAMVVEGPATKAAITIDMVTTSTADMHANMFADMATDKSTDTTTVDMVSAGKVVMVEEEEAAPENSKAAAILYPPQL